MEKGDVWTAMTEASLALHSSLLGNAFKDMPAAAHAVMLEELLLLYSAKNTRRQGSYLRVGFVEQSESPETQSLLTSGRLPLLRQALRQQVLLSLDALKTRRSKPLQAGERFAPTTLYSLWYSAEGPGMGLHCDSAPRKMDDEDALRTLQKVAFCNSTALLGTYYKPIGGEDKHVVQTMVRPGDVVGVAPSSQCKGMAIMEHGGRAVDHSAMPCGAEGGPAEVTFVCDVGVVTGPPTKHEQVLMELFEWDRGPPSWELPRVPVRPPSPARLMARIHTEPAFSHLLYTNLKSVPRTNKAERSSRNGMCSLTADINLFIPPLAKYLPRAPDHLFPPVPTPTHTQTHTKSLCHLY